MIVSSMALMSSAAGSGARACSSSTRLSNTAAILSTTLSTLCTPAAITGDIGASSSAICRFSSSAAWRSASSVSFSSARIADPSPPPPIARFSASAMSSTAMMSSFVTSCDGPAFFFDALRLLGFGAAPPWKSGLSVPLLSPAPPPPPPLTGSAKSAIENSRAAGTNGRSSSSSSSNATALSASHTTMTGVGNDDGAFKTSFSSCSSPRM
mmetsp:Transcript_18948/g.61791  ORF Transcript_18948/g.61791 Transcript_18948/m.61791 type:complete len:210 (-) Transcript_18948:77-706(-)